MNQHMRAEPVPFYDLGSQRRRLGTSIDEAMRHAAERDRAQWQLWDTAHPHNVSQVYRELEWE